MKNKHLLVLFLLILPTVTSLFRSGWYPMQDKMQYFRLYQMDKCIIDRQLPCRWVSDLGFGYGYPLFNYYPPLPFYLGYITKTLGFGYIDSIKILFVASIFLSALSMMLLAWSLGLSSKAGVLISSAYVYLPYRAAQIYVRGSLNEAFSFIFLPLILAGFAGTARHPSVQKWKIILIIGLVGQLLSHNLILFASGPILLIFLLLSIRQNKLPLHSISLFIKPVILSVGLSAFFIFPMLIEGKYVHLESLTSGYFGYLQHFSSVNQIFFSNKFGYGSSQLGTGDDIPLSIGAGLLLLLSVSLLSILKTLSKNQIFWTSVLLLALLFYSFLMHQKSTPIWQTFQLLQMLQFPWRLIIPASITSLLIIAFNFSPHLKNFTLRWTPLMIVTLVALHGTFFQPRSWIDTSDTKLLNDKQEFYLQQTASIFDYLPKSASAPPQTPALDQPEIMNGTAKIVSFQKKSSEQLANILVDSPKARVRFPFFFFPNITSTVNGIPADIFIDCSGQAFCYGTVSLDIPQGENLVSVRLTNTPIRDICNALSLLSIVIFLLLCRLKKL